MIIISDPGDEQEPITIKTMNEEKKYYLPDGDSTREVTKEEYKKYLKRIKASARKFEGKVLASTTLKS